MIYNNIYVYIYMNLLNTDNCLKKYNEDKLTYIVSIHYNNPLFIELQYYSLKKYVKNNYKFIVFDDSKDNTPFTELIKLKCQNFNIDYVRIDQQIHKDRNLIFPANITDIRKKMIELDHSLNIYNSGAVEDASARHCASVQFMFKYFSNNINDCKYLFNIDSDMFFINDININNFCKDINILYVKQNRQLNGIIFSYILPNLFCFNIENINGLNDICWDLCRYYDDTGEFVRSDTGGETYDFLLKNNHNNCQIEYADILNFKILNDNKNFINDNIYNLLNEIIINNGDNASVNQLLIFNNEKYNIFHLRGYTWMDNMYTTDYVNIIDVLLKKYLS